MKPKPPKKADPKPRAKSGSYSETQTCECAMCKNTDYPSIGFCKKYGAIFGTVDLKLLFYKDID